MKHIDLKKLKKVSVEDLVILDSESKDLEGYVLQYWPTKQFVDHDFVARELESEYAGFWSDYEGIQKDLTKFFTKK